ncbi:MAG: hypothetical protein Q8N83_07220 [Ignavibacteria bacterium]|nr:hypothetical protein [Ignavibacteria bacterium]
MKNSMCSVRFLLFIVLLFSNSIFAQEETSPLRFSLLGGVVLPQGDFGATSGEKGGYASTGFGGMIEMSKNLNENVNWVTSVSLDMNSIDDNTMESQWGGGTITGGNYVTTWAMTGIGFESAASPTVKVYGVGQVGLLFSSFPDITMSSGGVSITQTTTMGTAFAFGFGGGIKIDKINIGLRYYTGEPEYEQTATYMGVTGTAKVKMPATVLQLMLGINF